MVLAMPETAPAQPAPRPGSFANLAERLQPAVVNISTSQQVEVGRMRRFPFEDFFPRDPRRPPADQNGHEPDADDGDEREDAPITREARSLGSGFIIDAAGYVVTNNHVVSGRDVRKLVDKIQVTLSDGRRFDATVVGRDVESDIALLKIRSDAALPTVTFGDSSAIRVGDWVLAIGNPFGLGGTVTAGIVSALHRDLAAGTFDNYIQTDASINRGNSGGPMFDLDGRVIGINTAIFSPTGGNIGIGFAIPSSQAKTVIDQLREHGRMRRGWLGVRIQAVTDEMAEGLGLKEAKGAIVAGVEPDAPAAQAGVRQGDIIVRFNGVDIEKSRSLPTVVADTPIGQTADLQVLREGKPVKLRIKVGERPDMLGAADAKDGKDNDDSHDSSGKDRSGQWLGLGLSDLTPELRRQLELDAAVKGVAITGVDPRSDAASRGLRPGDVILAINNQRIASAKAAAEAVEKARKAKHETVTLLLRRGDDELFIPVKLVPDRK